MYESDINNRYRHLNKADEYAGEIKAFIRIRKLYFDSLRVIVHSDAASANNVYLSYELGGIELLTIMPNNAVSVSYKSDNSITAACLVLSPEIVGFF